MLGGDAKPTRAPRETRKRKSVAKERIERDEEDLVRLYLTDIGQYPLLTKDDEVRLAQQIEGGNAAREQMLRAKSLTPAKKRELRRCARHGDEAQRTFVQSNLRLVVSIAKKYQASGLPLLDLIQEGNLGLMHAVEKFDWRKGFKFSTYATWWIRQAITRGIANTGRTIRLPVHAGDTLARLQKARSRLELKLGRPATLSELAAEVEMPEDKVTEALRFAAEPLSLSEPLREDGDAELGDIVEDRSAESPFEVAATALLPAEIEKLLAPLDERERQILALRFGLMLTGDRPLSEDLVQEAFVRVAAKLDVLRDQSAFNAYLIRAVANLAKSHFRRQEVAKRHVRTVDASSLVVEPVDVATTDALLVALRALPMQQRAALVLRYYNDLSQEEIARVLDC